MENVWNQDHFTLTSIEIVTPIDGGFHLRQQKSVDQSELMSLGQRRSRADTDKLTPGELTQLRGVSGSANRLGNQTRPDLCVSASLLQGADTREANKLIRLCRQHGNVPIRVSPILSGRSDLFQDPVTVAGKCDEMDLHRVEV